MIKVKRVFIKKGQFKYKKTALNVADTHRAENAKRLNGRCGFVTGITAARNGKQVHYPRQPRAPNTRPAVVRLHS